MTSREAMLEVERAVEDAPRESLPSLIGQLEAAAAKAWARLMAPPAPLNGDGCEAEERNLSAKEAARRLGVSKPYLYKHANEYPFTRRIGGRVLFSASGLDAWNHGQRPGLTAGSLEG